MRLIAPLCALLQISATNVHADGDQRLRFSLKQDQADTGTNIKRTIVARSVIPLDKTYAELTPEQQGYLKAQYEQMGAKDEPPYPLNGLGPIYKAIAAGQQKLLISGGMTLAVEVNSQGEAISVAVLKSVDPKMVNLAASVLMFQKYKPALCDGSPCTMQFPFRISFRTSQ